MQRSAASDYKPNRIERKSRVTQMVGTLQTASLQPSRSPWALRRKRKIWRTRRIKAARSS